MTTYAIFSSSGYSKFSVVDDFLKTLSKKDKILIGNTNPVEAYILSKASGLGIKTELHRKDGVLSFYITQDVKNTLIGGADIVVAFFDGQSRGTLSTIKKAQSLGKGVTVYG